MSKILVKQTKSLIAQNKKTVKVAKSMGLGKINQEKVYKDNNCIRGMINKISHLVEYKLISE